MDKFTLMAGAAARKSIEEAMVSPEMAARSAMTRLREERGWNYSDLARAVDTTPAQIRKLENGDLNISLSWMQRLARVFGVKMSAFLSPLEVEAPVDEHTAAVLDLVAPLPAAERAALVQAAMNMMLLARRLSTPGATALVGSHELAEEVADRWNGWDESQRRNAVNLLKMAENIGSR